jgi:hypothetical protein
MRYAMFMIPRVYQIGAPRAEPTAEQAEAMMRFNKELQEAGVLSALEGLHTPERAARVSFAKGKVIVTDGPFAESKEWIGGFWVIEAGSREEVVGWAKRCPAQEGDVIEIRQIRDLADFSADVQKVFQDFDLGSMRR